MFKIAGTIRFITKGTVYAPRGRSLKETKEGRYED